MKARENRRQTIWMIAASMFVLIALSTNAQGQPQWPTDPNNSNNIYYNSGNVGIGTTSPTTKLEVKAGATSFATVFITRSGTGSGNAEAWGYGIQNQAANDGLALQYSSSTYTSGGGLGWVGNSMGFLYYPTEFRIGTGVGSTPVAIFNSSGNVGMGTTSPNGVLEVKGSSGSSVNTLRLTTNTYTQSSAGSLLQLGHGATSGDTYASIANFNAGAGAWGNLVLQSGGGNVGVGTTSPIDKFEVVGGIHATGSAANSKANDFLMDQFSNGGRLIAIGPNNETRGKISFIVSKSDSSSALTPLFIDPSGKVGISNTNPQYDLDVSGTINSNSTITANNIVAKYQDVAEWVESSEQLAAGTVVVLDSTKSNQVIASTVGYDTRVAGVISEQPGIALGEKGDGKVLVATTGRVKVKVDASKGAINIGDLLVTSDIPGVAMKSEPFEIGGRKMHMPGTLIGKALEPLRKGAGEILVLLSLQ